MFDPMPSELKEEYRLGGMNIEVWQVYDLPNHLNGRATWDFKTRRCKIELKHHPYCKRHEELHCLKGHWHPEGEVNTEYCD